MKKLFLIAALLLVSCLTATLIQSQNRASVPVPTAKSGLPEDVKAIVDHSCTPCHFDGGSGMALAHVNFSTWDNYSAKKQASKSGDICQMILNKKMPPASFTASNPGKAPTKEQAEVICKWAESLVYVK